MPCSHDHRCRYTHGFYCEDCQVFFPKDSPVFRRRELLSSLWMALHNVSAQSLQAGGPVIPECEAMQAKIGIGVDHEDYEALIAEAEALLARHGSSPGAATVEIKG